MIQELSFFTRRVFLFCFSNFQSRVCLKSNVNDSLAWSVSPLHFPMAASVMLHLTVSKTAFPEVSPYLPICFLLLSALLTIARGKLNVTLWLRSTPLQALGTAYSALSLLGSSSPLLVRWGRPEASACFPVIVPGTACTHGKIPAASTQPSASRLFISWPSNKMTCSCFNTSCSYFMGITPSLIFSRAWDTLFLF